MNVTINNILQLKLKCNVTERGCWEWKGGKVRGYGQTSFKNKKILAHRLSYLLKNNNLPKNLYVCHKCDNPPCCNPDHLFLGTAKDNMQDHLKKGRHSGANKTHCKRGHLLSGENLYIPPKQKARVCRICRLLIQKSRKVWTQSLMVKARAPYCGPGSNAALSEDQVKKIRQLLSSGEYGRHIGKRFGVSETSISLIKHGITYQWVK